MITGSKKVDTAVLTSNIPRMIERGRIRREVTNGGIGSNIHRMDENINSDRQWRGRVSMDVASGNDTATNAASKSASRGDLVISIGKLGNMRKEEEEWE